MKLIVEIIEPSQGRILDPACGSGGMFVQSAAFVERHGQNATNEISVYGFEKDRVTINLNKMNLAVHGLSGDVRDPALLHRRLSMKAITNSAASGGTIALP